MMIGPAAPSCTCTYPCHASSPARVTTNEGTPISATNEPWKTPISAATITAMTIGQIPDNPKLPPGFCSSAATTPATALT